jgi:hypothetical protein
MGHWDEIAARYDDYPGYGRLSPSEHAEWTGLLRRLMDSDRPQRVLDVGTGTGVDQHHQRREPPRDDPGHHARPEHRNRQRDPPPIGSFARSTATGNAERRQRDRPPP